MKKARREQLQLQLAALVEGQAVADRLGKLLGDWVQELQVRQRIRSSIPLALHTTCPRTVPFISTRT